jgi:hypothetical protein
MGTVEIKDSLGAPLSDSEVSTLEGQLRVSLPLDYAAFLQEHNGGSPYPNVFPITGFDMDNQGILTYFFGVKSGAATDLVDSAQVFHNRVPPELLPIATDVFGNLVCLAVSGPDRGKVYFWFHEEESDDDEAPTYDNVYFVADSFTELITSLTELEEDP